MLENPFCGLIYGTAIYGHVLENFIIWPAGSMSLFKVENPAGQDHDFILQWGFLSTLKYLFKKKKKIKEYWKSMNSVEAAEVCAILQEIRSQALPDFSQP